MNQQVELGDRQCVSALNGYGRPSRGGLQLLASALGGSDRARPLAVGAKKRAVGAGTPLHSKARALSRGRAARADASTAARAAKRACDIVLAAAALLILSPFMLIVALAIKVDSPGPVIFRQRRIGLNGRQFQIFKFRSMSVLEDGASIGQSRRNDPRATKIGRLLRQSSADELPQLINVLLGDMSLVGPRPHAVAHDEEYGAAIPQYAARRLVKPGITGWAQVNGLRGETQRIEDMKKRIEFDLFYVDNWSLRFDLAILWRTCFEVMRLDAY